MKLIWYPSRFKEDLELLHNNLSTSNLLPQEHQGYPIYISVLGSPQRRSLFSSSWDMTPLQIQIDSIHLMSSSESVGYCQQTLQVSDPKNCKRTIAMTIKYLSRQEFIWSSTLAKEQRRCNQIICQNLVFGTMYQDDVIPATFRVKINISYSLGRGLIFVLEHVFRDENILKVREDHWIQRWDLTQKENEMIHMLIASWIVFHCNLIYVKWQTNVISFKILFATEEAWNNTGEIYLAL